jgi:hypothetical protein
LLLLILKNGLYGDNRNDNRNDSRKRINGATAPDYKTSGASRAYPSGHKDDLGNDCAAT